MDPLMALAALVVFPIPTNHSTSRVVDSEG